MAKNKEKIIQAEQALNRLMSELEIEGGFDEYSQHCEELLRKIIPYLNEKGLDIVIEDSLNNCRIIV